MDSDFWQQRWRNSETAFHQSEVNPYLQQFWPRFSQGKRVFVPLAGKSRDMLWLAQQGHQVIAVELSEIATEAFFMEAGLSPQVSHEGEFSIWETAGIRILCGDFFELDKTQINNIDTVYDRASLIAMPTMMRARYASHLMALVDHNAPVLLITLEYDQMEMNGPPFAVFEQEIRTLYENSFTINLMLDQETLEKAPRFREKGLTWLREKVYGLHPRKSSKTVR